jgi:hypothetical protein
VIEQGEVGAQQFLGQFHHRPTAIGDFLFRKRGGGFGKTSARLDHCGAGGADCHRAGEVAFPECEAVPDAAMWASELHRVIPASKHRGEVVGSRAIHVFAGGKTHKPEMELMRHAD